MLIDVYKRQAQAGQAEFAVAAVQQHAADRVLEPLERLADRRLAQVQGLRRPAHACLLYTSRCV